MTVLHFPTKRKARYRSSPVRIADYPENVVCLGKRRAELQERWRFRPDSGQLPAQSPEMALLYCLFHALASGPKDDRRLLSRASWQLARMGNAAPADPSLDRARNFLDMLRREL
ncbi:MAG: hypothetical protein Q7T23_09070 [Phenylobacterium sp.]|nr:hypothetical protein [Phenylobacterium sp.]